VQYETKGWTIAHGRLSAREVVPVAPSETGRGFGAGDGVGSTMGGGATGAGATGAGGWGEGSAVALRSRGSCPGRYFFLGKLSMSTMTAVSSPAGILFLQPQLHVASLETPRNWRMVMWPPLGGALRSALAVSLLRRQGRPSPVPRLLCASQHLGIDSPCGNTVRRSFALCLLSLS
jgi:hypothetical protein